MLPVKTLDVRKEQAVVVHRTEPFPTSGISTDLQSSNLWAEPVLGTQ